VDSEAVPEPPYQCQWQYHSEPEADSNDHKNVKFCIILTQNCAERRLRRARLPGPYRGLPAEGASGGWGAKPPKPPGGKGQNYAFGIILAFAAFVLRIETSLWYGGGTFIAAPRSGSGLGGGTGGEPLLTADDDVLYSSRPPFKNTKASLSIPHANFKSFPQLESLL
jgi:hypothetical protein